MTPSSASWFVTGGSGLFGHAFCTVLLDAGARVTAVRQRHPVVPGVRAVRADLTRVSNVDALFDRCEATHVVHAAAITDVDRCEGDEAAAEALHVDATRRLASAAARRGARFILLSTDQLATGDTTGILHVAGRDRVSKFEVARAVAPRCGYPPALVEPCSLAAASLPAPRPTDTSLDCGRAERLFGRPLPSIDTSIAAVSGRLAGSDGSPR